MAADHEDMQPESHSPGFHPPPDRQTDLLVLQCELMSAGWLTLTVFPYFILHPVLSVLTVQ